MPRKKITENDALPLRPKRKRNLPAVVHEDAKENVGRNTKKKKNDALPLGNTEKITCSTEVIACSQSAKRTRSTALSKKSVNQKKNDCRKECVICINTVRSSYFTVMSCDHSFHAKCIKTWFQVNESCPICMPVNSNTSDRSEFEDLYEFCNKVECVICMDTGEFPDYEFISCGHSFHAVCVQKWFQVKRICPICMPDIFATDCSNIFEDQKEIAEFYEEVRCLICLDTEEFSSFETIFCCHSFHVVCIQTWFAVKQVCPVCMVNNPFNACEDDSVYEFPSYVGCNICMDTEVSSDFHYLPCGHDFHAICIKSWIKENKSCPTCLKETSLNIASNTLEKEMGQQGDMCAICMDTEESSVFEFLPCCHSFHAKCIQSWIKKEKSCPICKTHISVNQSVNLFKAQGANAFNDEDDMIFAFGLTV